jgi:hypothetical protein
MTTDLRAALRDNLDALRWLLIDQQEQQHDEIDAEDDHHEKRRRAIAAVRQFIALADTTPTVAELLARRSGASGLIVERASADDSDPPSRPGSSR